MLRSEEGLLELRALVEGDSSIVLRTDDRYLLRFLHCVDFEPQEAFEMIKTWNALRLEHAEWFCSAPPEDHGKFLEWHTKAMLDGRDRWGRRIYLTKMGKLRASEATIMEMSRFDELWIEAVLDEPNTQAAGVCCIIDMDGFSWRLLRWLTPRNVRVAARCVQSAPIKSLVVHVVNSSMLLDAAVSLVFPFLGADLKKNIHFHQKNWTSLHEHVDPEHLPEEYGGARHISDFSAQNAWLIEQSARLVENFKRDGRM